MMIMMMIPVKELALNSDDDDDDDDRKMMMMIITIPVNKLTLNRSRTVLGLVRRLVAGGADLLLNSSV